MRNSIRLPKTLEERLAVFCRTHGMTEDQVIERALQQFFSDEPPSLTPYALGAEGFGADRTHSGDIAKNSRQLLTLQNQHRQTGVSDASSVRRVGAGSAAAEAIARRPTGNV